MITPGFNLTATERILPKLALDFTTASLDPRITFTRASNTATVTNSSGTIVGINANLPRFDYDPVTLVCKGLLVEETRTNLLLNSLLDGTSLGTQSVTVTAAAHTLSFYGTGTVVLSGARSATINGSGAYPTRTISTFTPTAGTLTLTVTGTVQFANLELGAFATSFIPTDGTTKTRNTDDASMTGANFTSWYNATDGALFTQGSVYADSSNFRRFASIGDGTTSNLIYSGVSSGYTGRGFVVATTTQASFSYGTFAVNTPARMVLAYKLNSIAGSLNGGTVSTDNTANIPTVSRLDIGFTSGSTSSYINGHVQKVMYWPQRITDAEVRAFAK